MGAVFGVNEAIKELRQISAKTDQATRDTNNASALMVRTHAIRLIQQPGSGRVYTRSPGSNRSREHQASAPGEAPATDTGILAGAMYVERARGSKLSAEVGPADKVQYGKHLEYGTRNMAPRPFLKPAFEAVARTHQGRLVSAIRRALKL